MIGFVLKSILLTLAIVIAYLVLGTFLDGVLPLVLAPIMIGVVMRLLRTIRGDRSPEVGPAGSGTGTRDEVVS